MKYKVGDKVKVRKDLEDHESYDGLVFVEDMEEYRGKIMTIRGVIYNRYWLKEDESEHYWSEEMLEPVITNWDKVKESITAKDCCKIPLCTVVNNLRGTKSCFDIHCDECREWLTKPYEEPKKEILDKVEKEYLSAVIKPFRNRDVEIIRAVFDEWDEYIAIEIDDEVICLPYFKSNTMYKGMEIGKEYTLEELGL